MTDSFTEKLAREFADHSALPYLFIGSGISMRYLGLPDWQGLLRIFSDAIGEDYDYQYATADGDLPLLASNLAEKFHDVWWNSKEYEESRLRNKGKATNKQMALKIEVSEYISKKSALISGTPGFDLKNLKSELELFKDVVTSGIITTNYDSLTDIIFPNFPSYVGQRGLLLSDAQFVAESYKIHGTTKEPESIVLTHEDYEYFNDRNKYLAAKLLTIFVEHPVIFMGYRMSDENIRRILEDIAQAAGPEKIAEIGTRLYFVDWKPGITSPTIEPYSISFEGGVVIPLKKITVDDFSPLYKAMHNLERPYPAQVVRELTKYVYDLVRDPNTKRQSVTAVPINSPGSENLKIVFGVGEYEVGDIEELSSVGLRGLDRLRVANDILETKPLSASAERMLTLALPEVLKRSSYGWLPVFKYLRESGRISDLGKIDYSGIPDIIRECANRTIDMTVPSQPSSRYERVVEGILSTPTEIMESDYTFGFKIDCLLLLDPDLYSLDDLKKQLIKALDYKDLQKNRSQFFRALCHYDRLMYASPH